MTRPSLIIVTGASATGKTTVARELSRSLGIPLVAKDRFKEALFDALGPADREWSRRLGAAAMRLLHDAVSDHLGSGCSVIAEANFKPPFDEEPLRSAAARAGANVVQIMCTAADRVRLERVRDRVRSGGRHPGHCDDAYLREDAVMMATADHKKLELDGRYIEVATDDAVRAGISELIERIGL